MSGTSGSKSDSSNSDVSCNSAPSGCSRNFSATTSFNCSKKHTSHNIEKLKPGELLRLFSDGQCAIHYVVCLDGDGEVAHLTTSRLCQCESKKKDGNLKCKSEDCEKAIWGRVELNNIYTMMRACTSGEPPKPIFGKVEKDKVHSKRECKFTQKELEARAMGVKGATMYGWWKGNCEHFATWCAYDVPVSAQSFCKWNSKEKYLNYLKGGTPMNEYPPEGEETESEGHSININNITLEMEDESKMPEVEKERAPRRGKS